MSAADEEELHERELELEAAHWDSQQLQAQHRSDFVHAWVHNDGVMNGGVEADIDVDEDRHGSQEYYKVKQEDQASDGFSWQS